MAVNRQDWLDAQYSVLGSVLISPEIAPMVLSEMSDTDFSGHAVAVYQAMRYLFAEHLPVDVISVRDKLGPDYSSILAKLMEITPTAANYAYYMEIAKKQSRIHRIKDLAQRIVDAVEPEEVQRLLEQAVVINSKRQSLRAITMEEALAEFVARHGEEKPPNYLPWMIPEIGKALFIDKGDYVIIGGRPSAGKTAFALQAAWHMATDRSVAFFSLETGQKKLTDRQVSDICDIPMDVIKHNKLDQEQWQKVVDFSMAGAKKRRFELVVDSTISVDELLAFSAARQYEVIVIDYLHLLHGPGQNDYERVSRISRDLHRFSQSHGCTVIALSQLNRIATGQKTEPDMNALRESGQLEQDADAILLLYLENEKTPNGRRILKCAKNKDGERFRMLLNFDGAHQRFSKVTDYNGVQSQLRRMAKERKKQEQDAQLTLLPPDEPVPFEEEEEE